jgi:molecular chaperone GrpE
MSRGEHRRPLPPDVEDDVEIVEVVGLDEDHPVGAEAAHEPEGSDGAAEGDAYEIDVVFEDSAVGDPGGPAMAVASAAADGESAAEDPDQERYLRLQAEFENLKKRVEREKEDFYVHATSTLVERLLPVLDNFDRAIVHAMEDPATGGGFLEGVRLIHKQFLDELTRQGLKLVETVGTDFDPERHEAVATDPRDDEPPGTVLAEIQKGYYFRDRLLRPALVQVSVDGGGGGNGEGGDAADHGDAGDATEA